MLRTSRDSYAGLEPQDLRGDTQKGLWNWIAVCPVVWVANPRGFVFGTLRRIAETPQP